MMTPQTSELWKFARNQMAKYRGGVLLQVRCDKLTELGLFLEPWDERFQELVEFKVSNFSAPSLLRWQCLLISC
jgi:hypothetical protein